MHSWDQRAVKRGRKQKGTVALVARVTFACSDADEALYRRHAKAVRLSLSEFIRLQLKHLEREVNQLDRS